MKVHEAIAAIVNRTLWARPVGWRGSGQAIHVYNQCRPAVVPSACGGKPWHATVEDILDDWEVVEPNVVLDEKI